VNRHVEEERGKRKEERGKEDTLMTAEVWSKILMNFGAVDLEVDRGVRT